MELGNCGEGDHSAEMQSALKKFEDVCNSLEDEHNKLVELEKRRQKLNEDLERLRNEIKEEKNFFRSVIDEQFEEELEQIRKNCTAQEELAEAVTIDTGAIKDFIQNQREQLNNREADVDLDRFKENLKQYLGEEYDEMDGDDPTAALDEKLMNEVSKDDDGDVL